MTADAGVLRTAASLDVAAAARARARRPATGVAGAEIANLAGVARAVCAGAVGAEETRGRPRPRWSSPNRRPEPAPCDFVHRGELRLRSPLASAAAPP